ncbi:MAG: ATP-dependent DNA helicase [Candidatus Aenigmarchaeota archaeon]|nr:ATP-dependent DNA helicase [Candidatus Aenigmarchaeota archaeon]
MSSFFPFDKIRPGQKEMLADSRSAVRNGKILFAHAPTGIGKTAAVLSPALEYALGNDKVVFFVTPRHSQHILAIDTLKMMKKRSEKSFVAVDLIGKKWLCPVPHIDTLSNSDFIQYCKVMQKDKKCKFYNNTVEDKKLTERAKKTLRKLFAAQPLHTEELFYYCKDKGICPYELTMRMMRRANLVVADYYHIFSPARVAVMERLNKTLDDIILIVDEAHNLPDRVRNLMSARISSYSLRAAIKEAREYNMGLAEERLSGLLAILSELAKNLKDGEEDYVTKGLFIDEVQTLGDYYSVLEELQVFGNEIREEKKRSFVGSVGAFLEAWLGDDYGYARIISRQGRRIALSYTCLDPSLITKDIFDDSHAAILMSGTLKPMRMYIDLLGIEPARVESKEYESPFPKENRLNLIVTDVTTKYENRNEEEFKKIVNYLVRCVNAVPGNVAVFFPSYEIRDRIYHTLVVENINKEILLESQNASKEDRKNLMNEFISLSSKGCALFGVIGGSFDQGIDLPGEFLKAVLVIGIPFAKPDLEMRSLIDYYDKRFARGWEYAYIYPAIIKAVQAGGRCIRSEKDRGVVVLMDKRYVWSKYRNAFPSDFKAIKTRYPEKYIEKFFS